MYALMNENPDRNGGERKSDQPMAEKERRKKSLHNPASKAKKESRDKAKPKRDSKDHKASKSKHERKNRTEHRRAEKEQPEADDQARREKQRKHKSKHRHAKREETDHEQEEQETTCFCQKSLRALKPQDVNLFLPRCLPCTCGRQKEEEEDNIAMSSCDQYPLDEILRPWQAEFLENEFMVTTVSELLASCERIGPVMAREMKRWCKHSLVAPMVRDVQSCTLALFIWTKSCKMILSSSKRPCGAVLYKVKVREPTIGNNSSRLLNKSMTGDAVPKVIVIPPSCRDDEVSACSSQGASTVLEDFLENIFHWELPNQQQEKISKKKVERQEEIHDKPKTIEIRKPETTSQSDVDYHDDGWDLMTPKHDEYAPRIEISNMEEVMVSLEMYECMDKTMSRAALEQKLAKMSSVLNRVNINLITTDSPPLPEDNKSMESLGGSVHKEKSHRHERRRGEKVVDEYDDESDGEDTTVTEPTTKSASKGEAARRRDNKDEEKEHLTTKARRPRLRRDQWHSSIAFLAAFDGVEGSKEKAEC